MGGVGDGLVTAAKTQDPETWSAESTSLVVWSSAYAMWAQPWGSTVSMMKSARWRLERFGGQAIPRLQMSPTCMGLGVILVRAQVGLVLPRSRDWPAHRNHWLVLVQLTVGKHIPGQSLPLGPVGTTVDVCSQATSTIPGSPAAMAGNQLEPVLALTLNGPFQVSPASGDPTPYMTHSPLD